ncbi:DUF4439 domain-containing protein [uncultured Cellulomonas sp.]|uniref:DUF4439 domain-containing protein n=1 Tax=uncultured Cellulomonas sp. TaxID=189682 RepID=UPI002633BE8C|nr:DUF4439 domain-containing protein [uncultured Cellulomonas sp.]
MSHPRTPTAHARRAPGAVLLVLVLALVSGCGLRLETPPPAAPTPDAREAARQRASADAVAIDVLAAAGAPAGDPAAAPPSDPAGEAVAAARAAAASDAQVHLDALGALDQPEGATTGDDADPGAGSDAAATDGTTDGTPPAPDAVTPAPEPTAAAPEVLANRLTEAAATARADAATIGDGPLARLLGSIAVNRLLSAARLADAAGLKAPPVPAVVLPESVPDGVGAADLEALIASEDAAGYALEVVAAKHDGDLRSRAGDRAAVHRDRAQTWAELADVDGTGLDPRRVAYALPDGLDDAATAADLAQSLETALADHYAGLVAAAGPDARVAFVDAVAEATAQAVAWGAPLPALPGLPERGQG